MGGAMESVGLKGFVEIEVVNKKTGVSKVSKTNNITDIGKLLFLATSASLQMMSPSQIGRGALSLESSFSTLRNTSGTLQIPLNVGNVDTGLNLYMLNSGVGDVLTSQSRYLPVLGVDGRVDQGKLVGFANYRHTPSTPKEGVIDRNRDEHLMMSNAVVQRWRFDSAQANGTFNRLCIGAGVHTQMRGGFAISKGINPIDGRVTAVTQFTGYMRPGVPGFTSDQEILVGQATATHVFNLVTGVLTQLEVGDVRLGISLGGSESNQVFHNGHLYYGSGGQEIMRLNVATRQAVLVGFTHPSPSLFRVRGSNIIRWQHWSSPASTFAGYNMDTLASVADLPYGSQSNSFGYFSSTPNFANASVGNDADGNYITQRVNNSNLLQNITFTDLANIQGSVIEIRPTGVRSVNEYVVPLAQGSKKVNLWSGAVRDFGWTSTPHPLGASDLSTQSSLHFSENWFGDLISYVDLQAPITKTVDDVLFVSYGYRFE